MTIASLAQSILNVPLVDGRRIIAIAGPPASGKSTLAAALHDQIAGSQVLPMDGFHRSNDDLSAHGLLARKGAPETFDVAGFVAIVQALRAQTTVPFPTFDRARDCVVPNGGTITPDNTTILVEGNYLLLDISPWDELRVYWDHSVMLDMPIATLEARLIQRWLDHGHDAQAAHARAHSNDLPNAVFMQKHAAPADQTVTGF